MTAQAQLETCEKYRIKISAYASLSSLHRSRDGVLDPVVNGIADNRGMTESQVLLAWALQVTEGPVIT